MKNVFLFLAVLLLMVPAFTQSCMHEQRAVSELNMNEFTEYLTVSADAVADFSVVEAHSLLEAIHRVCSVCESEKKIPSDLKASDINVSDKLFSIILSLLDQYGITKSGTPSDCVAAALSMWGGASRSTIDAYITSLYGYDGVPEGEIFNVIKHFFPNAQKHYADSINLSFIPSITTTVGYFHTGADNAHMVNIDSYSSSTGTVTYVDVQNGFAIDSCSAFVFSYFFTVN